MRIHHRCMIAALTVLAAACQDSAAPVSPVAAPSADRVRGGAPSAVELTLLADGFTQPVGLVHANDRSGRLFVIDQPGLIRIINADGTVRPEPFLDLTSKIVRLNPGYDERGLLGLAFHPEFRRNGRFFVYYSAPLRPGAPAGARE